MKPYVISLSAAWSQIRKIDHLQRIYWTSLMARAHENHVEGLVIIAERQSECLMLVIQTMPSMQISNGLFSA